MSKKLTRNKKQPQIKPLTIQRDRVFKVVFAGEANDDKKYHFNKCNKNDWYKFGRWIDTWSGKTLTDFFRDVNERNQDRSDKSLDPLDNVMKDNHHYSVGGKSRIYGYFNAQGYFVVRRVDPGHDFHKRK